MKKIGKNLVVAIVMIVGFVGVANAGCGFADVKCGNGDEFVLEVCGDTLGEIIDNAISGAKFHCAQRSRDFVEFGG